MPRVQYALQAVDTTSSAVTSAASASFTVAPLQLRFAEPPTNGTVKVPLQPAVSVQLDDATGQPKADDNGTAVTLATVGYTGDAPVTGNTATTVNGVATFPDLTFPDAGTYTLQATDAANDGSATSGKFVIGNGDVTVALNSRAPRASKKGVESGDLIFYDAVVSAKKGIEKTDYTATLPAGFTPKDVNDGGVFAGDTITWHTTDRHVGFELTVPGADALAGLSKVTVSMAVTSTFSDDTTGDGSATDSVKIAGSYEVDGTLHDAQFQFPRKLTVSTAATLGGVTVDLIDPSDGSTVDTAKTTKGGAFTLTANTPGTYTVEFDALVNTYASAANGVSTSHAYAGRSVTIPAGNTKPVDLKALYLPVTFFATAATTLTGLNNYRTSGFQNLPGASLDLLQFDTTAPEATVTSLLGTAASPSPLLNRASLAIGGPTDPWVAGMRSIAACATIDSRFTDTFRLTDQAGKTVAVLASAAVARNLGKTLGALNKNATLGAGVSNVLGPGFRLASVSAVDAKLASATRVAAFTTLGATLGPLLDAAGVSAANKGAILGVVFNVLRYSTDLLTGNLIPDLGFEAVFNLSRIATDAAVLETLTGVHLRADLPAPYSALAAGLNFVSPGTLTGASFQSALTLAGSLAYNTNTDTQQVLSTLDKYDAKEHDAVTLVQAVSSPINSISSLIGGLNGTSQLQQAAAKIGGTALTPIQAGLQSLLTRAQATTGSTVAKLGTDVAVASLAVTGAGLVEQAIAATFIPNLAANSVLFGTALARPAAAPHRVASPASVRSSADAAAYLVDLTTLSAQVSKGDPAGLPDRFSTFVIDDHALFDADLTPLDEQASAVLATVPAKSRPTMSRFDADLNVAVNATLLAELQLSAWGANPVTGKASAVTAQFTRAVAAVTAAARDAAAVRAILAGRPIPPTLAIDETSVPTTAAAGSTQTFTLTVTNLGDRPTDAGTVTFTNDDGGLTVHGNAAQPLPALGASASANITYQLAVLEPANGDASPTFQIVATAGDAAGGLTDTVTLS